MTTLKVERGGEGCLVAAWELEHPGPVDVAVGPGTQTATLTGLPHGRHYVSVIPPAGELPAVAGERRLVFEGATNFRDIGGLPTADGAVTRWGQVFRSDGLDRLSDSDLDRFAHLGIRAVYDLRGDAERAADPDRVPSEQIALLSRHPSEDGPTPLGTTTAYEGEQVLAKVYVGMLDHSAHLFGKLFSNLAERDRVPAVLHCAGGKDRTGMAVALLLACLDVDRDEILDDYTATAKWRTVDDEWSLYERLLSRGVTPEAAAGFLGTPRWAMVEALQHLDKAYGGAVPYLLGPGGLPEPTLCALRQALIITTTELLR
jgi:protein-tyrosine phosphatase